MIGNRKKNGSVFCFMRLLAIVLSINMVLIGLPVGVIAEEKPAISGGETAATQQPATAETVAKKVAESVKDFLWKEIKRAAADTITNNVETMVKDLIGVDIRLADADMIADKVRTMSIDLLGKEAKEVAVEKIAGKVADIVKGIVEKEIKMAVASAVTGGASSGSGGATSATTAGSSTGTSTIAGVSKKTALIAGGAAVVGLAALAGKGGGGGSSSGTSTGTTSTTTASTTDVTGTWNLITTTTLGPTWGTATINLTQSGSSVSAVVTGFSRGYSCITGTNTDNMSGTISDIITLDSWGLGGRMSLTGTLSSSTSMSGAYFQYITSICAISSSGTWSATKQ